MWSVTAIAPIPRSLAVSSRTSTGVAQSFEWSVCMCRSQSIVRRREIRRRTSGSPRGSWRRAVIRVVDALELVGDLAPTTAAARVEAARAVPLEQLGSRDESLELAGERDARRRAGT